MRQQEENLQRLNKELSGLKSKYTQVAQQEQAVQSEIDRIRRAFNQSTSKASQILIGMNKDDVIRLCGEPRSSKIIVSTVEMATYGAWNYGNITIIFDEPAGDTGLVIKGVNSSELNSRKEIGYCQNILKSLYSE